MFERRVFIRVLEREREKEREDVFCEERARGKKRKKNKEQRTENREQRDTQTRDVERFFVSQKKTTDVVDVVAAFSVLGDRFCRESRGEKMRHHHRAATVSL